MKKIKIEGLPPNEREYGYKVLRYLYDTSNTHYPEIIRDKNDLKKNQQGKDFEYYAFFEDYMTYDLHKLNKHIVSLSEYFDNLISTQKKYNGNGSSIKIDSLSRSSQTDISELTSNDDIEVVKNPDNRVYKEKSKAVYYESDKPICSLEGSAVLIAEIPYIKTPENKKNIILYKLNKEVEAANDKISQEELKRCSEFFTDVLKNITYEYKDEIDLTYETDLYK